MKTRIVNIFIGVCLLLFAACVKEPVEPTPLEGTTIHYKATVSGGVDTRASVDNEIHYIFETGDKLYVKGEKISGCLTLSSGAGKTSAAFEGDLVCTEDFHPVESTLLTAVLVSAKNRIHTVENGELLDGLTYGADMCSDFADAVSKYGNFSATDIPYGDHYFKLAQTSAFVVGGITSPSTEIPADKAVDVILYSGDTPIRSGTVQSVAAPDDVTSIRFAAAFNVDETPSLTNAKLFVKWGDAPTEQRTYSDIYDTTLEANKYYSIARTTLPFKGFRIRARKDATTIVLNYDYAGSGIQYSLDGTQWFRYESGYKIVLDHAGDEVCVRGTGTLYNTDRLFSVEGNKECYVYGDLMSLVCDYTYTPKTNVAANAFQQMFKGMTKIDVPAGEKLLLSATTLGKECYKEMFHGCTGLTTAPTLPATTLAEGCYLQMFWGCSNLQSVPDDFLPATTLANNCYQEIFRDCTKLKEAPSLPATTLANDCYRAMFHKCTGLTKVPENLPATTAKTNCYYVMFYGCSSLENIPDYYLPATTLANNCYQEMFRGCSKLTSLPEHLLPATTLAQSCYKQMFFGCSKLTTVPEHLLPATTLANANNCYLEMFRECSGLTTVPAGFLPAETLANNCYQGMFYGCTELKTVPTTLLPATELKNYCYSQMFYGCSKLDPAPTLPATTLADYCYNGMFYNCTGLVTQPVILAQTLAQYCCFEMFRGCTSLETPPALTTVTKLANYCYYRMFFDCAKLTAAPELPLTTLTTSCYREMFQGCASLTTAPTLPATVLTVDCYRSMFNGTAIATVPDSYLPATELKNACYKFMFANCTKLTAAPELPAPTLVTECYQSMFEGCSTLNYVRCLAKTNINTSNSTTGWLKNVASTGTFYYVSGTNWPTSANGIPGGWNRTPVTP